MGRRIILSKQKNFDISQLITRDDMITKVKEGKKTAVRRNNRYGNVGDTFQIANQTYELVRVYEQYLGDVTEANAKEEGFENLDAYKESITSIHDNAVWVPKLVVWVHEFQPK